MTVVLVIIALVIGFLLGVVFEVTLLARHMAHLVEGVNSIVSQLSRVPPDKQPQPRGMTHYTSTVR